MRSVWNAAEKDLRRHCRDPYAFLLWLGLPLLIGGLISLAFGGTDRPPPTVHLLIADEDGGIVSGLLSQAFGQAGEGQFLHVEMATSEKGRERMSRGEASALVVIPEGFGVAVLNEKPTTLLLVTNPAQQILPQIVEKGLEILVDGTFYAHRVLGPELHEIAQGPPAGLPNFANEDIARISVAMNKVVERVQKYLFPPVIALETTVERQEKRQDAGPGQVLLPGILFMSLLFMGQALSVDVWRERDQGTLRRAACTPSSVAALLAGKLLAAGIVILASTLFLLIVGMLYLQTPLGPLPLAALWGASAGVVFFEFFTVIQMHATSQRAGMLLTNSIVMPLLFMGGSFFPFEAMPAWMSTIGKRTPNGWALIQFQEILAGRVDARAVSIAFAGLVAVAAVLFLFSERRMRRVFARS